MEQGAPQSPLFPLLVFFEVMPELRLLRADITLVFLAHGHRKRHAFADGNTVLRERVELRRVVAHQPHRRHAEDPEDRGGGVVFTGIVGQAEVEVRLDGVAPLLLQRVSANLVAQADPAPFMPAQIQQHAAVFGRDVAQCEIELLAAVAAVRAEHVAGQAFGMQPRQHGLLAGDVAHHEREMFGIAARYAESVRLERTVACGQRRGGDERHALVGLAIARRGQT